METSAVGCAATGFRAAGLHAESRALRGAARAALEELCGPRGRAAGPQGRAAALEQAVVRALEPHQRDLDAALAHARQGEALARGSGDAEAGKRFAAARRHVELHRAAARPAGGPPARLFEGVPRLRELSAGDFGRRYSARRTPVVVASAAAQRLGWDLQDRWRRGAAAARSRRSATTRPAGCGRGCARAPAPPRRPRRPVGGGRPRRGGLRRAPGQRLPRTPSGVAAPAAGLRPDPALPVRLAARGPLRILFGTTRASSSSRLAPTAACTWMPCTASSCR
ncbi:unnamed protein product [Prorocentrum cordatum]|uniref:Uncharacterized protein n=1 Tax=Prorocentrum cordatum TaxID=2364126 RepID=A0ABN9WHG7_9DINO|nr:unnamed protein product [Polarella glacialis]